MLFGDEYLTVTTSNIGYYQQQPVWSMVYSGGIVDIPDPTVAPHTIYPFLQAALRLVSIELPYRGPEHYAEHGYQYTNRIEGLLQEFRGNETITTAEIIVYRLRYNGGILH